MHSSVGRTQQDFMEPHQHDDSPLHIGTRPYSYVVSTLYDQLVAQRAHDIHEIHLGPNTEPYKCTPHLLRCASDILSALTPVLLNSLKVQLSYGEIEQLLLYRYGKTFITVSCNLLVQIHLLAPPLRPPGTDRRLIWQLSSQSRDTLRSLSATLFHDASVTPQPLNRDNDRHVSPPVLSTPQESTLDATSMHHPLRTYPSSDATPMRSPYRIDTSCNESDSSSYIQKTEKKDSDSLSLSLSTSQRDGDEQNSDSLPTLPSIPQRDEMDTSPMYYPRCTYPPSHQAGLHEQIQQTETQVQPERASLFAFFHSRVWSSEVVEAIFDAMDVLPWTQHEQKIAAKQAHIVYEQMKELLPSEACRRLILTLEYMKTTQPFWRQRYESGQSIVLSLGTNFQGTHHHCLELYEELTRRGWKSKLETQWLTMQNVRTVTPEEDAYVQIAIAKCEQQGISQDMLDFEDLVALGKELRQRQLEPERGTEETASASRPSSPTDSQEADATNVSASLPRSSLLSPHTSHERGPSPEILSVPDTGSGGGMNEDEAFDLVECIVRDIPALRRYIFRGNQNGAAVTIRLAHPTLGSDYVLSSHADWSILCEPIRSILSEESMEEQG